MIALKSAITKQKWVLIFFAKPEDRVRYLKRVVDKVAQVRGDLEEKLGVARREATAMGKLVADTNSKLRNNSRGNDAEALPGNRSGLSR